MEMISQEDDEQEEIEKDDDYYGWEDELETSIYDVLWNQSHLYQKLLIKHY